MERSRGRRASGLCRAVHQNVQAAKGLDRRADHSAHRLVVSGVHLERDDSPAGLVGKLPGRRLQTLRVARGDCYVHALHRKLPCDGFANASAASGDYGGLAV